MSRYFSAHDLWAVVAATIATVATSSLLLFMIQPTRRRTAIDAVDLRPGVGAGLLAGRAFARLLHVDRSADPDAGQAPHIRRVILIGVDRFTATAIKLTDYQEPRTTQIVSALDERVRLTGRTIDGVRIVGKIGDLAAVMEEYSVHGVEIDEVWFGEKYALDAEADRLGQLCRARGVRFAPISSALNLTPLRAPSFSETRDVLVRRQPSAGYFRFKRMVDFAAAAILLSASAPIALMVAIVTQIDVGAPIIFWQQRIGRGGRRFILYKFRTYQAPFARDGAPIDSEIRLSKIGRFLRATRFDEIPQLVNIVRGDMSLIGPRPLLPKDQPSDPRTRLLVRPGVTGWAQVNGGNLVTAEEKDALDVWYIHHASPSLDVRIIWRTWMVCVRGERRDSEAIEAAFHWCEKTREIDEHLFGGRRGERVPARDRVGVQLDRVAPIT